jgi:hypothetical protein
MNNREQFRNPLYLIEDDGLCMRISFDKLSKPLGSSGIASKLLRGQQIQPKGIFVALSKPG